MEGRRRSGMVPPFVRLRKSPLNGLRGRHLHSSHHFCAAQGELSTHGSFVHRFATPAPANGTGSVPKGVATVP